MQWVDGTTPLDHIPVTEQWTVRSDASAIAMQILAALVMAFGGFCFYFSFK